MAIVTANITETTLDAIDVLFDDDEWVVEEGVTVSSETGFGLDTASSYTELINEGTLRSSENFAARFAGDSGTLINTRTGLIVGEGGIEVDESTWVENAGSILATGDGQGGGGVAIVVTSGGATALAPDGSAQGRIVNSGSISGAKAAITSAAGPVHLVNRGDVSGLIEFASSADTVANAGAIFGDVRLGKGVDLYDGRGGLLHGEVNGGGGADKLLGGDHDDVLVGCYGDDAIRGGRGDDTITGGPGRDLLSGGADADSFVFVHLGKVDRVRDFRPGDDAIHLESDAFAGLGRPGALRADAFHVGRFATDEDHRVIYNAKTGVLKHDANGDAAGGVVKVAVIDGAPTLSHHHFEIV